MTMGTRIVVLKDGFIQQVAAPQTLYEEPANLFVAGFIGTPQMNTCEATVSDENGVTYLSFGADKKIALPASKGRKPEVLAYVGKKVIMGIRPSDMYDDAESLEKFADASFDMTVEMTELLGAETNLYLIDGDIQMTAVVHRTSAKMDDRVKVCLNPERVHLFDYDTEMTITN
jgi:multiple sugar transport system ATP-binding protein